MDYYPAPLHHRFFRLGNKLVVLLVAALFLIGCDGQENAPELIATLTSQGNDSAQVVNEGTANEGSAPEQTNVAPAVETNSTVQPEAEPVVTAVESDLVGGSAITSGEVMSDTGMMGSAEITATIIPTPTSSFVQTKCQFETAFLERGVKCGYVTVPENHEDPYNGRTLDLHVAVLSSDTAQPSPDPLVYLAGGPGEDALKALPFVFDSRYKPLLQNREIVVIDQRGTGYSRPTLDCPEYQQQQMTGLKQRVDDNSSVSLALSALQSCQQRLQNEGIDLTMYHSVAIATDIVEAMNTLEYEMFNLWGVGYGARVAQTIMRDHPDSVRSAILDSAYPLDANLLTETPNSFALALNQLFQNCANDSACSSSYPDLERSFYSLAEQYMTQPAITQAYDPFNGQTHDVIIDGEQFIEMVIQGMHSAEIYTSLPKMIHEAQRGDLTLLNSMVASSIVGQEFSTVGRYFSTQCHEEFSFVGIEQVNVAVSGQPQLKSFFDVNMKWGSRALEVCSFWPSGASDATENVGITSDIPTLILAGSRSPIIPASWGQAVADNLSQSTFLTFPTQSHNVSSSTCAQRIMVGYLQNPGGQVDTSCIGVDNGAFAQNTVTIPQSLVPFEDAQFNISGIVPEGWNNAGPGAFARQNSALDQTMIIQQGVKDFSQTQFLTLLASQLNLDLSNSVGNRPTGDQMWTLYQSAMTHVMVDVAISEYNGVTFGVVMFSHQAERDGLYAAAFLPALDAIQAR